MKNTPSPAGLRMWRERLQRATRKQEASLKETRDNTGLINNDPGAWAGESPVRGDSVGKTTLIVRNTLGQNARSEVNRLMPKEPKWIAEAVVPFIYEEVNGEPVEQDNARRSMILQTAMNYVSNAIDLPEVLEENAFDGEAGNVSFTMSGYEGAGDISHTAPTPYDTRDEGSMGDLNAAERKAAKMPGAAHGSVKPYLPTNVRLQRDKVLVDPDAATPKAVNWIAHLVARPLPTMKAEKINEIVDEEIIGPDGMPVMAQNVKTRPKYVNLDDLKPNANPSDVSGPNGGNKKPDGYMEDFLHFWEIHYRVRAEDPTTTKDGFSYWILSMVDKGAEGTDGSSDSPVYIRHEPYPFDVGGFYITMYRASITIDDLFGFVPGIRDAKGPSALFNTVSSQIADGTVRNKTVHWFNKNVLQDEDIEALANAQHTDWVGLDIKQNVPPDMLMGVVPSTPYGPEVIQEQQFLAALSDSQTGRSDNQRGDTSNVRTAAEANIVAQEAGGQVAAKQKRFRKFAAEVMRKSMIIFTHVLPEDGLWYIPDTGKPGKFLKFQKRDLFCNADIRMDLVSQVLKDDTVVVQQGMQLLDVLSKIMMAPPELLKRMTPMIERTVTAMGPDWEATSKALLAPEVEQSTPENEHLMFVAGEYVEPDQNEDLMKHYETHKAALKAFPRDPALGKLFYANSPAMMMLIQHLMATEEIMQAKGMAVDVAPGQGGAPGQPGAKRGRGVGSGSVPQAAPSGAELEAAAGTVQGPARMGQRGRMGG